MFALVQVNFGDVKIPRELEPPRPARLAALSGVHGVSSEPVVAVDAQTLLVPHFSYDGEAPDAKFWVGRGRTPTSGGIRIPDENGKEAPLRRYDRKTIVLTLPGVSDAKASAQKRKKQMANTMGSIGMKCSKRQRRYCIGIYELQFIMLLCKLFDVLSSVVLCLYPINNK